MEISTNWKEYRNAKGYCGCFCGGCLAFHKNRCHGCGSHNRDQARISKWKCKIRNCVIDKELNNCAECNDFIEDVCKKRKYLINRYRNQYSIDLDNNSLRMKQLSEEEWIKEQISKITCKHCGSLYSPYDFICYNCHKKQKE